ncbi:PhzF family phenazine biosynthesis protein [Sporomusa acidovorans]|uniref:Isomerase YddE n=1 Tax=Sporomusa acidovorans (strain ATCC 49682 / DSM 3132 / Mol) TaxID=1123286 RepID=A0ABZ3IZI5_SPOA4|nr:PhzF family phenazine biosynthesis protein [Sporomusa acidovorans]OZC14178.1 putative isomerase YddE [Sporomusa acidovorans DSM 3132]SDE70516.1 phenazine biosynthesis protein PhzF family [Sporomusa acidovorans]
MGTVKIKQVDAFTTKLFGGNPAGVVTDANGLPDAIKQKIAREMNLSETAFVSHSNVADFKVQFFTPNVEVPLCGHATIATFATLYEEGKLDQTKSVFYQETKAGVLPVEVIKENSQTVFMMTQAAPQLAGVDLSRAEIAAGLGLTPDDLLETQPMKVSTGLWWLVVGIKSLSKLSNAHLDFAAIAAMSKKCGMEGFVPFCLETVQPSCSFHSRAFCPLDGINEDPVCGTGNGSAAAYIAAHNLIAIDGEAALIGEAGLEVGRPGQVNIIVSKQAGQVKTVKVGGTAVRVMEGEMVF